MNQIATAVFGYDRKEHLQKLFESIERCDSLEGIDFYLFLDGPKSNNFQNVKEVRDYIDRQEIIDPREIIIQDKNIGLANSIISGVSKLFETYEEVIVLEDDLRLAPSFFTYMKEMLSHFKDDKKVYSISGYNYPKSRMDIPEDYKFDTFFSHRPHSWGWATWKNCWKNAIWDIDNNTDVFVSSDAAELFNRGGQDLTNMLKLQCEGKINSWAIRWAYTHYKLDKYAVYPVVSLVENEGFDGSGTHCKKQEFEQNNLTQSIESSFSVPLQTFLEERMINSFYNVFKPKVHPIVNKVPFKDKIKKIIKAFLK